MRHAIHLSEKSTARRPGGLLGLAGMVVVAALALAGVARAATWQIEIVDSTDDVGVYPSLVLDTAGNPHISHYDLSNQNLKYAAWDGSTWQHETVDNEGGVGAFDSLALDGSGYPHISYYDLSNQNLKYAAWDGSAWQIETVDSAGRVGAYTSLALDAAGNPHISYYDETNTTLKHAAWDGSAWQIETVDSAGKVGKSTSLALDGNGYPHITYYDITNTDLKYAVWDGSNWQIETIDGPGTIGSISSLALDADGNPHISYLDNTNADLKYAAWDGSGWQVETVDSASSVALGNSMALDGNENPHIGYVDQANYDLKYATWDGSSWQIETVESAHILDISLALDGNGNPHIGYTYSELLDGDFSLKYAAGSADSTAPVISLNGDAEITLLQGEVYVEPGASVTDDDPAYSETVTIGGEAVDTTTPGVYVVTYDAPADAAGNVPIQVTRTVTVLSTQEAVGDVIGGIEGLVDGGALKQGQANGLIHPLDNAVRSLDKGNTASACSQLADFITEVEAKTPVPLDAAAAAELIAEAERIQASIGCP